jgi:hypothetical protein
VRDDTPLTPTRFEGIAEIATGGDTGLRAPLSITRLKADCWYRRPLGCHYGWYNPHRIQAGLGGLSPNEYEDRYHRELHHPDR